MVTQGVMAILLGAFLTLITAWSLGRLLLRTLRASLCRLEEDLLAVLAGSACLSGLVFLLCCIHLAREGVFAVLCVASIGTAFWRGALRPAAERLPRIPRLWLLLFLLPFAVYTVLYFFNALAPETNSGGGAWRLGNVVLLWHDHGFVRSNLSIPQGLEMLFLYAFSFGGHSSATLVHFVFLATLPWLMLCYGRRFGLVRPVILGALLVYLSPIAGVTGTGAYNDLAVACVLFGLFYILQIWDENRNPRLLWVGGLLAGFAVAAISITPGMLKNWSWELPMQWSLSGASVQGLFGPWLLLTPLALLAVRSKQGRRLLLAAAFFALPALLDHSARLLLPCAVFVAPALGMAVQNSPGMLPLLLLLHSLISWPYAVAAYADPTAWRITGLRVAPALRWVSQDAYLRNELPGYAIARAIDELVPENAQVLTLCPVPQSYTTRRLWNASEPAKGQLAAQAILTGYQSLTQPPVEIRFRMPEQSVRALRVVSSNGAWSVIEMRVYLAGVETPRRSGWRVSARPNWFDASRAFDNSEVTAWSTGQSREQGMYLEEDFDEAVRLDSVVLVSPPDQPGHTLRLEGLGTDGLWRTVTAQPETALHWALPGLRRAASGELKSLGFDYVVTRFEAGPEQDMVFDSSHWGITCLREVDRACVYRLD